MKGFVAGVFVTLVCIVGGVYTYFAEGFAPVATASRPMPFEEESGEHGTACKIAKANAKDCPD